MNGGIIKSAKIPNANVQQTMDTHTLLCIPRKPINLVSRVYNSRVNCAGNRSSQRRKRIILISLIAYCTQHYVCIVWNAHKCAKKKNGTPTKTNEKEKTQQILCINVIQWDRPNTVLQACGAAVPIWTHSYHIHRERRLIHSISISFCLFYYYSSTGTDIYIKYRERCNWLKPNKFT